MGTLLLVALDVALILVLSRLLGGVLERVQQPRVIGEVLAGVVLGASVLGVLPGDPSEALFPAEVRDVLRVIGEVALFVYVFRVVAGLDLGRLRAEGGVVARVAVVGFAVPFAAGVLVALAVLPSVAGDPPAVSFVLFLATAFGVTAFPVLARIVEQRGLQQRRAGRVALAAAAGQELFLWPALALIVGSAGAGTPVAAIIVLSAFAAGLGLPRAGRDRALAALDTTVGRRANALLLPVFFALPALDLDVGGLGADGFALLAFVLLVAVAGKVAGAGLAARSGGLPAREALTVGALMNARGLVELVVLGIGLRAGLLDERLYSVMVLMALATTLMTGPVIARLERPRASERGSRPLSPASEASSR